jgi:hypothetical protein
MEHLFWIWIIFGIFAILYFVFEIWRHGVFVLGIRIPILRYINTVTYQIIKQLGWRVFLFLLLGPVSLWISMVAVEKAKKEFDHEQEN